MSAFDDWKASLPAGQGYSAEEAFNAGMTAAAQVCKDYASKVYDHAQGPYLRCASDIEKARDEK